MQAVQDVGDGQAFLRLVPPDGRGDGSITVVAPPERVVLLPPEELSFDPAQVGPIGLCLAAHRDARPDLDHGRGARFGRVALEAYQAPPVLRILARPSLRLLIADDVGLGNTIEAGLCLLDLLQRGRASRVLVVCPPGLIPRIVTSTDYLKRDGVRRRALAKPWDLVIVDEAHALVESGTPRNPYRTRRTRLGEELRDSARGLLLLTATPHNGYARSFRSLIEVVWRRRLPPSRGSNPGADRAPHRRAGRWCGLKRRQPSFSRAKPRPKGPSVAPTLDFRPT
ncbi:MAG: hypothetical protein C4306_08285 [Thermoleophilia bacterium]